MAYRVLIPTPLRPYTDQQDAVEIDGSTVGEVLSSLTARYGELRRHLYSDEGKLRSFVNIYVNDDDIRYLDREATALKAGDVLSIVPSVAGGAPVATPIGSPVGGNVLPELTNAEVAAGWLARWIPISLSAVRRLQPIWSQPQERVLTFEDSLHLAKERFRGHLADLGLDEPKELDQ